MPDETQPVRPFLLRHGPAVAGILGLAGFVVFAAKGGRPLVPVSDPVRWTAIAVSVGLVLLSMIWGWMQRLRVSTGLEPDPWARPKREAETTEETTGPGETTWYRGRPVVVRRTDPAWVWFAGPFVALIAVVFITLQASLWEETLAGVPTLLFMVAPIVGVEIGLVLGWWAGRSGAQPPRRFGVLQMVAFVALAAELLLVAFYALARTFQGFALAIPTSAMAWGACAYVVLQAAALGAHLGERLRATRPLPESAEQAQHVRDVRRRTGVVWAVFVVVIAGVVSVTAGMGIGRGADGVGIWSVGETYVESLGESEARVTFPADQLALLRSTTATSEEVVAHDEANIAVFSTDVGAIESVEMQRGGSWTAVSVHRDDEGNLRAEGEDLAGATLRVVVTADGSTQERSATVTLSFAVTRQVMCSYEGPAPSPIPEDACSEPDPSWKPAPGHPEG